MCAVSNIGDQWQRKTAGDFPWWNPTITTPLDVPSRTEFNKLKEEVEQMKKDLEAAKKQDEEEGNPDCEMADKVAILKALAKLVGVSLDHIFQENKESEKKVGRKRK